MEDVVAAHRYYIWANRLREHLDALPPSENTNSLFAGDYGLFLSHWYGALYVVIEAWEVLGFTDPVIDNLLESPNKELLRRFRNGTFHFQRKYYSNKFLELAESEASVDWVRNLNREFGRYFFATMSQNIENGA